jgi:monofunctional biosynthetic peptidoglycan transglycosylase
VVRLVLVLLLAGPPALILVFRVLPPPATPLMLLRLAQGHAIQQEWVAYERIAPALAEAVIAAEDNRFCAQALGFDFAALRGQVEAWRDGERPRGASTITMQTAKNLLLWPKRRVMEVYLNVVEFGPGLYGAEAAARAVFGKPASALSAHEAARLAAVLPNPLERSAVTPSPQLRRRATIIERRVAQIRPLLACAR